MANAAFQSIEIEMDMEPTLPFFLESELPAFELKDPQYGVFFEGFASSDIVDGALVRVGPPPSSEASGSWACCTLAI